MPTYLTPEEVAEALKLTPKTVLNMARRGQLPRPIKLTPKIVRWDWTDIRSFLARKHQEVTNPLMAAV